MVTIISNLNAKVLHFDPECDPDFQIKSIEPITSNCFRIFFVFLLSLLSLFTLNIAAFFYPNIYLWLLYRSCSLEDAEFLVVRDLTTKYEIVPLSRWNKEALSITSKSCIVSPFHGGEAIIFEFRLFRYVYSFEKHGFVPLTVFLDTSYEKFQEINKNGISRNDYRTFTSLLGNCDVEIEVKSTMSLALETLNDFFYFFQAFACVIWLFTDYYNYLIFIIITTTLSLIFSVRRIKKNLVQIAKMASYETKVTYVKYNGESNFENFESNKLTVGSKFELPLVGECVPCDCILASGTAIVNECCLTGESDPIIKEAYTGGEIKESNILYCGSEILQLKPSKNENTTAICHKIGFSTKKGTLIRSIMLANPPVSKFEKDSLKYIKLMFVYAVFLYFVSFPFFYVEASLFDIVMRFGDILTVVVPPALPACLNIGILFAVKRLKTSRIKCTQANKVGIAGRVDSCIFDKTGTLTENELGMLGVVRTYSIKNSASWGTLEPTLKSPGLDESNVVKCLATCHSLINFNDKLEGDPIEKLGCGWSGWKLCGKSKGVMTNGNTRLEYITVYEFDAQLRSMGVLVRDEQQDQNLIFFKGSPEEIASRCLPDSIPANYHQELDNWTNKGYRVLGLSYREISNKEVDSIKLCRQKAESSMIFLGLIIVKNELKLETLEVISKLIENDYLVSMCTGDNLLTAIAVGVQCSMISNKDWIREVVINNDQIEYETIKGEKKDDFKLAITGKTFEYIYEHIERPDIVSHLDNIVKNCKIYARMSPVDKKKLIWFLKENNQTTFFVGDGANDCGALKEADIGLSLSVKNSSFAAPFSSESLSGTIDVLIQGKSSLCASIECFKFMMAYSLIQSYQGIILQIFKTYISDNQFLAIDLFAIIPVSFALNYTSPASELQRKRVQFDLLSWRIILPYLWHNLIVCSSFMVVYLILINKPWFEPATYHDLNNFEPNYENTAFFMLCYAYYFVFAFIVHIGKPLRKSFFTNWILLAIVFGGAITSYLTAIFQDSSLFLWVFELKAINDMHFRVEIVIVSVITCLVCFLGEKVINRYIC